MLQRYLHYSSIFTTKVSLLQQHRHHNSSVITVALIVRNAKKEMGTSVLVELFPEELASLLWLSSQRQIALIKLDRLIYNKLL